MCVMNHTSSRANVEHTVNWLAAAQIPMPAPAAEAPAVAGV
jgi:hypothetical protein